METRDFRDGDLREMQQLVQDAWTLVAEKNRFHVGDLAWGTYSIAGEAGAWRRRLWEEDGRVVAWGWLLLPGTLDLQVDPRRPELLHDVLDWFEETAEGGSLETTVLAGDTAAIEVVHGRGYAEAADAPFFAHMLRDLESIDEPAVPVGYTLRSVGDADVEKRVDVHRAAWEPSRFTAESYGAVRAAWPYRAELDCVVEAPDGSFAASALAWLDEENRVGELEPVGTRPSERRRGLGRTVNLFALQRLREAGAERAIVYPRGDAGYPIPKLLYESVGFRQHSRSVSFGKVR